MTGTSKEYAIALFGLAAETENEEAVLRGLAFVKKVFDETPQFTEFLKSPAISKEVRLNAVRDSFEGNVPDCVVSFVSLLCEHGDIESIYDCIADYENLYNDNMRTCSAVVTSAIELNDDEKASLSKKLAAKLKKQVEIKYAVDPSVIGGIKVETDGYIYDGTVKRRLQTMKGVIDK